MAGSELANQCLLTAISLLRGEIETATWAGDLYITPSDGGTWDVHKRTNEIQIYVDTIQPSEFGSAQILGAYLKRLHERDAESVDLPKEGKHMGEILE